MISLTGIIEMEYFYMRCYTFQNIKIVDRWLELFESGVNIITRDNIDNESFHFTQSRTKKCYNNNDFIYTFYHCTYDTIDFPKAWLKDNYYLTNVLKWYFPGFNYDELIMLELNIPADIGILGELDSTKIVDMHYVQNTDKAFEYVLPYLNKDWLIDYYSFKEISEVPVNNGIEIIPANYTTEKNKLIKNNAPLIWDTSIDVCDICNPLEEVLISSIPFEEYRIKCRQAFYSIEETHLF